MNGWTRKDALAYVGWWSDHSARVVTALRAGGMPYERDPDFDIDAQNRSIFDEFRDRDPGQVRAFEAAAFERLVAAVEAASDEDLFTADGSPGWERRRSRLPWRGIRQSITRLPRPTLPGGSHRRRGLGDDREWCPPQRGPRFGTA
jgi:hypothetical protein